MQIYKVGGCVRDKLLNQKTHDVDWVVVGATPEEMLKLGYTPVGSDFPVFLHPQTKEQYALARTDRKTGVGYKGFQIYTSPDITLEEDLLRRDLTINAMAEDVSGNIIDPFNGKKDLEKKIFRHVSEAFREDPLRILRVARFAARWPDFTIADETLSLMKQMVQIGEVKALVAERVWQEISRGLMETKPSRMLEVLRECGALRDLLPEVEILFGVPQTAEYHPEIDTGLHTLMTLDMSAKLNYSLAVRWSCLIHDVGKGLTPQSEWPRHIGHDSRGIKLVEQICERMRVPVELKELSKLVTAEHIHVGQSENFSAKAIVSLFERCDAFRRAERFQMLLEACECDARGRLGFENKNYLVKKKLTQALNVVNSLDQKKVVEEALARGVSGPKLGEYITQARVKKLIES